MTLILDAGALVAIERGDRDLMAVVKIERLEGRTVLTHGGVVGQVWRGGARQANVARALAALDVRAIDEDLGRQAGILLGMAGGSDVMDAAVVLLARDGDEIITSDVGDLEMLAAVSGRHVELIPI